MRPTEADEPDAIGKKARVFRERGRAVRGVEDAAKADVAEARARDREADDAVRGPVLQHLTGALIEAHRFGDGASGRNGGQMGTGQRSWAEEQEAELGFARAKALFDLAEEAKRIRRNSTAVNSIDIDFMPGQMSVAHKQRYVDEYKTHAELMAKRFSYPHMTFMDKAETAERLGSTHYFGGMRDTGTGISTR